MKGRTAVEKILSTRTNGKSALPGELVWATVDWACIDDVQWPIFKPAFAELGGTIFDRNRVIAIADHYLPASTVDQAETVRELREFVHEQQLPHGYFVEGVKHQVFIDEGLLKPGELLVATDSHTPTAGAAGAIGIPVGPTEVAAAFVYGTVWLRVPRTIQIVLQGSLPPMVFAKDIALQILGQEGTRFGNYRVLEFEGAVLDMIGLAGRMTLANMGTEMEATLEQPTTLDEVSSVLLAHEDTRIIAGGTALTLLMKEGLLRPSHIVALRRVPGLVTLEEQNGLVRLGSMVTQHTLEISPLIARKVPIVAEAASKVGNIRVRAVSTVGGSLSEADYQSDLAPALAVLNARVHIYGKQGGRNVSVTEFLRGMYEVDLQGGEIVTGVDIPVPAAGSGTAYLKHVTGPITDRPCLGVAAIVTLDERNQCRALRLAISSVMGFSSRPLVLDGAALGLIGRPLNDDTINAVAEAAFAQADPPDDLRGSAWYRKQMTRVFARRALARTRLQQR